MKVEKRNAQSAHQCPACPICRCNFADDHQNPRVWFSKWFARPAIHENWYRAFLPRHHGHFQLVLRSKAHCKRFELNQNNWCKYQQNINIKYIVIYSRSSYTILPTHGNQWNDIWTIIFYSNNVSELTVKRIEDLTLWF